jgi:hypothetical protein
MRAEFRSLLQHEKELAVAFGQQRLIDDVRIMSAYPSTPDISLRCGERRKGPTGVSADVVQ